MCDSSNFTKRLKVVNVYFHEIIKPRLGFTMESLSSLFITITLIVHYEIAYCKIRLLDANGDHAHNGELHFKWVDRGAGRELIILFRLSTFISLKSVL